MKDTINKDQLNKLYENMVVENESDFYDKYYDENTDEHNFTGAIMDKFFAGYTVEEISEYIGWDSESDIKEIMDTIEEGVLGTDTQLKEYRDRVEQAKRKSVSPSELNFLKKLLRMKEQEIKEQIEELQNDPDTKFAEKYKKELQDELETGLDKYHK